MVDTKIRLIIFIAAKDRLGADCGSDHELLITKFRQKLKKVEKTARPFRYDLTTRRASLFLPGESQGQGSLVVCRLWGHTESDMTEVT